MLNSVVPADAKLATSVADRTSADITVAGKTGVDKLATPVLDRTFIHYVIYILSGLLCIEINRFVLNDIYSMIKQHLLLSLLLPLLLCMY